MLQISFSINDIVLRRKLQRALAKVSDTQNLLNGVGAQAEAIIKDNFNREEDSRGQRWARSIRANEQGGKTLQDTGRLRSIIYKITGPNSVLVGTPVYYGKYMQYGRATPIYPKNSQKLKFFIGKRGPIFAGQTKGYPAREWLYINEKGRKRMRAFLTDVYKGIFK